ncbi:hypothetical protein U27_02198 [Candidatus Vecturithrix granuli]|uniref:Heavy-metal chelation domain-containing protein n=1 Tax=Vecturithrix granuli TaxID=1499967 RepID=A0A0S6W6S4_VECG1|nr:hypothetical protein U27_02198 [Candidatus Vecturithrix granuli]
MTQQKKPTIDALIDAVLPCHDQKRVTDIRIGLGYTAVKLNSGECGVACTLRHRLEDDTCSLLPHAGTMAGLEVVEAIPLLRSQNMLEAAVGLATINAIAAPALPQSASTADAPLSKFLGITSKDRVGMVGYIGPIVKELQQCAHEVIVFDEAKTMMKGITPTEQEAQIFPHCDVVILSATSLLNKTFDSLLEMALNTREICVMGPSTPLLPEVFRERRITLLAGRRILDADKILQIVSEAGGTKRFEQVTQKVYLPLKV